MRTGILLPKSSTHPLLGHDFFGGLKAALGKEQEAHELFIGNIGFGIDRNLIYSEAEKLWLEKQVEVLVVFATPPNVEVLYPISQSLNKLLIVVNSGAKYPVSWKVPNSVVFLNLQEWLNSALTGSLAAQEGHKKGVFASNFYDGGYAASHSMSEAYASNGGEILYNFIGKHLLKEFDTAPLKEFLNTSEGPLAVLSLFSGALASGFLEQLEDISLQVWANPAFLQELAQGDRHTFPSVLQGYVSWMPQIEIPQNEQFLQRFEQHSGRKATAMALLGWESGNLLQLIAASEGARKADVLIDLMKKTPLESPRGILQLDPETHHFFGPSWHVMLKEGNWNLSPSAEDQAHTYKEHMAAMPSPPQTGWVNTYLCS